MIDNAPLLFLLAYLTILRFAIIRIPKKKVVEAVLDDGDTTRIFVALSAAEPAEEPFTWTTTTTTLQQDQSNQAHSAIGAEPNTDEDLSPELTHMLADIFLDSD